jgi:hypothetical protein
MTGYPKNDWRNAVPESDTYDRDALIAFRESLKAREQTSEDMAFVIGMSDAEVNAYGKLCEAWTKQFGEQENIESPPKVESLHDEPKDLNTRIQHRLDQLETCMKENKRDEAAALVPDISKFWSVLSQQDKEFIQCVRIALDEGIDWKVS